MSDQDIRHSAERTRQWSTARRLVNMVENMAETLEGAPSEHELGSHMLGSEFAS
ncbi:hypothetical protein GCM10009668_42190 [Nocardioides dubius]|uniref:Uncharacterized protein n=1 Tax=Nocardioides dubius TaxID=317019 RepID=A0ABP4EQL9_9ACTN